MSRSPLEDVTVDTSPINKCRVGARHIQNLIIDGKCNACGRVWGLGDDVESVTVTSKSSTV